MSRYQKLFNQLTKDPAYLGNLDWGKPRRGHPEGTVRAHIEELEGNLSRLPVEKGSEEYWKLKILIHVHDSFKKDSKKGVPIDHPHSHASLARRFLERYCREPDLLNMVQYHDEPYALYRQYAQRGRANPQRLSKLLAGIGDWELFCKFLLVDNCTEGKDSAPTEWNIQHLAGPRGLEGAMREWLERLQRAA